MDQIEKFVQLSDPGEVGREEHNRIDRFIVVCSNVFAWLFPLLMMTIVIQVFLRNFGRLDIGPGNQAWLDDMQWWMYGAAVLIGIAYAVTTNSHVRVDIFFEGFRRERQTRIEIIGLAWLFLPFILLCWDMTFHYAMSAVVADEGSDSPNGLHNLWMLKVFMNLAFVFIAVAIWGAYTRFLARLTKPALWKQLLVAFPATMFALNLTVYYLLYWWIYFTGGPDLNTRRITREAEVFKGFELGPWEIQWTVLIALILTFVVIGLARLFDRRAEA